MTESYSPLELVLSLICPFATVIFVIACALVAVFLVTDPDPGE